METETEAREQAQEVDVYKAALDVAVAELGDGAQSPTSSPSYFQIRRPLYLSGEPNGSGTDSTPARFRLKD